MDFETYLSDEQMMRVDEIVVQGDALKALAPWDRYGDSIPLKDLQSMYGWASGGGVLVMSRAVLGRLAYHPDCMAEVLSVWSSGVVTRDQVIQWLKHRLGVGRVEVDDRLPDEWVVLLSNEQVHAVLVGV